MQVTDQAKQQVEDLKTTSNWLFIGFAIGILVIVFHFGSEAWLAHQRHESWPARGSLFTALLWAAAWFSLAFLLGFLFGIPKVLQTTPSLEANTDLLGGSQAGGIPPQEKASTPRSLRVNTNLEEISDWLTKILVGAGLTQLVRVPGAIRAVSLYMATGMEDGAPTFAAALLLFFSSLGFFSGYLLTRMFISLAFARADLGTSFPNTRFLDETSIALGIQSEPSEEAQIEASKLGSVEVSNQLTPIEALAVSKAANLVGNSERALAAAQIAVSKAPENAVAHLNLAIALHNRGRDQRKVMLELDKARALSNIQLDPSSTEDIYNSLMYLCLYVDSPLGYSKAIELGEEFIAKATPAGASIWINLACAYAQKYEDLQGRDHEQGPQLQELRSKALECIRKALARDSESRERILELFHGNSSNPTDDDLKIFENDSEFKKVLGE